jgi:2-dehydropantoate 2-reductase
MKIAILGMGGIGSAFAFHLARHGHDVTAIARGKRLQQLQTTLAIVTTHGETVPVRVAEEIDPTVAYDLVLVTVPIYQVDAVLGLLSQSAAKTIMFAFNLFEKLDRLRDAVGKQRFAFGFPAIFASLEDGKLKAQVATRGPQKTVTTDANWAQRFTEAGIPAVVSPDMESWLHTHAAFVAPFMALLLTARQRNAGVSWAQARLHALAMRDAMHIVKSLGYSLIPGGLGSLLQSPTLVGPLLWTVTRIPSLRAQGAISVSEPRALIDAMIAAAPESSSKLRQIRP